MTLDTMQKMGDTLVVVCNLLVSALLVVRFYKPYVEKRSVSVITGISYFAIMTILYICPIPMSGLIAYPLGAITVCSISILAEKKKIPQKIFLALTIYMFLWISSEMSLLPWKGISKITFMNPKIRDGMQQFILYYIAVTLLYIIQNVLRYLEIIISEKVYYRKKEQMSWREFILFVTPYVAIIAGYWIFSFLSDAYFNTVKEHVSDRYPIYDGLRGLFGFIAFLATISVIYSYQKIKQSRDDQLQNALVSKQVEELSVHVHSIEKLYAEIRGIKHDINDHIMVLGNLLEKGDNASAVTYLNEWHDGFPATDINARTGNPVTDIVISEKRREAEESGIEFIDEFRYPTTGKVEAIDIAVILNNALANAVRASKECSDSTIEVKSLKNNNAYLIQVKNTFSGELSLNPDTGLPETSKDDIESHGYGLKNIKRITEKYYGTIQLEQKEDVVIFTAMLMIPE